MNKLLLGVIGVMGSLGITIGTLWVQGVNADREIIRQLQFKDQYLNGNVPAAPVAPVMKH